MIGFLRCARPRSCSVRRTRTATIAQVLACLLVLFVPAQASAAPARGGDAGTRGGAVSGTIRGANGWSVVGMAGDGRAVRVVVRRGRFRLAPGKLPLRGMTLHLVRPA